MSKKKDHEQKTKLKPYYLSNKEMGCIIYFVLAKDKTSAKLFFQDMHDKGSNDVNKKIASRFDIQVKRVTAEFLGVKKGQSFRCTGCC